MSPETPKVENLTHLIQRIKEPINEYVKEHFDINDGFGSEFVMTTAILRDLYFIDESKFDFSGILKERGQELTSSTYELASALAWIQAHPIGEIDGKPNILNDMEFVGSDKLFLYDQRRVNGVNVKLTESGRSCIYEQDETFKSKFAFSRMRVMGNGSLWVLTDAEINILNDKYMIEVRPITETQGLLEYVLAERISTVFLNDGKELKMVGQNIKYPIDYILSIPNGPNFPGYGSYVEEVRFNLSLAASEIVKLSKSTSQPLP